MVTWGPMAVYTSHAYRRITRRMIRLTYQSRSRKAGTKEKENAHWSRKERRGIPQQNNFFKKAKKEVCRLHNTAPNGCPYGKDCIFTHRCTSCGATDEHGRIACPYRSDSPANPAWAPPDYTSAPATRR